MTNIDFDHPDYFADINDVFSAFQEMALQVKKGIIACGDDEELQKFKRKYLLFSMDLEKIMISKHATSKREQMARYSMYSFVTRTMIRSKLQDTAITAY